MTTAGDASKVSLAASGEPSEHRVDLSPPAARGFDFDHHRPLDVVDSWVPASRPATWVGAA